MRDTIIHENNLIEILSSERAVLSSARLERFNPLHVHGRERSRERSAIGNRLIGIIRQYWQFVAPISQFPFATRRAKFYVSFFRWGRLATFRCRQSYRVFALFVNRSHFIFTRAPNKLLFRRGRFKTFLISLHLSIYISSFYLSSGIINSVLDNLLRGNIFTIINDSINYH